MYARCWSKKSKEHKIVKHPRMNDLGCYLYVEYEKSHNKFVFVCWQHTLRSNIPFILGIRKIYRQNEMEEFYV